MRGNGTRSGSTDAALNRFVRGLEAQVARKELMPKRQELIELIESGKHVLIGAKALAHYTQPRFTQDSDYIVSGQTFARIRKWMREDEVEHEDLGLVIRFVSLGVEVIDARSNAVLKEILRRGKSPPLRRRLPRPNMSPSSTPSEVSAACRTLPILPSS